MSFDFFLYHLYIVIASDKKVMSGASEATKTREKKEKKYY
jgi:hypothetical protein